MVNNITKAADRIPSIVSGIEHILDKLKPVSPETRALTIRFPESTAEVSILVRATPVIRRLNPKVRIPRGDIRHIEVFELTGFRDRSDAVYVEDDNWTLDLGKLDTNEESALVNVEYQFKRPETIRALVSTGSKADVVGTQVEDRYWMHAALKNPAALERVYGSVDLRDIDVGVDVGIFERLRAALPKSMIQRIDTLRGAVGETDRDKRFRAVMRWLQLRKSNPSSDEFKEIATLRQAFTTRQFRPFVDIGNPFIFDSANPRGTLGGVAALFEIPKFVEVVSRTDLTLKVPAAKATLVYKAGNLKQHLTDILENGIRNGEMTDIEDLFNSKGKPNPGEPDP